MPMFIKKLHQPFFLFLFPLFFVFHGFTENFYFVPVKTAFMLTGIYLLSILLLTASFYFFSRKILHAALMAAMVMAFNFFFGYTQDLIRTIAPASIFVKYSFLTALFLVTLAGAFFILRKKNLSKFTAYLNILFCLLIIIEIFSLLSKPGWQKINSTAIEKLFVRCDSCAKPDIYIIVLDGYPGDLHLKEGLLHDNNELLGNLTSRGFRTLQKTRSNYIFTPYSMASTLNMEYLDSSRVNGKRKDGIKYALEKINNNKLVAFLQSQGYLFYNHSIFRVAGQAASTTGSLVPANARLITANTFLDRIEKDVFFNLATRLNITSYLKRSVYAAHRDNEKLYALTIDISKKKSREPKVVYTHLMMPHDPYYFNEKGELRTYEELSRMPFNDTKSFLENLNYSNKKLVSLVDSLLVNGGPTTVIAILSDHGFRYDYSNPDVKYHFSNLLSIYMKDGDYSHFRDSMSNVNFFNAVLNTLFHQEIPMRKDSVFTFGF